MRYSLFIRTRFYPLTARLIRETDYLTQQHKVVAAAAIFTLTLYNFNQRIVMQIKEIAFATFLEVLILWKTEIEAVLRTNQQITSLSARQRENYENATRCYICRHKFDKERRRAQKSVTKTTTQATSSAPPTASVTWSVKSASRSQSSFTTYVATMLT